MGKPKVGWWATICCDEDLFQIEDTAELADCLEWDATAGAEELPKHKYWPTKEIALEALTAPSSPSETLRDGVVKRIRQLLPFEDPEATMIARRTADHILTLILNKLPEKKQPYKDLVYKGDPRNPELVSDPVEAYNLALDIFKQILEGNES